MQHQLTGIQSICPILDDSGVVSKEWFYLPDSGYVKSLPRFLFWPAIPPVRSKEHSICNPPVLFLCMFRSQQKKFFLFPGHFLRSQLYLYIRHQIAGGFKWWIGDRIIGTITWSTGLYFLRILAGSGSCQNNKHSTYYYIPLHALNASKMGLI